MIFPFLITYLLFCDTGIWHRSICSQINQKSFHISIAGHLAQRQTPDSHYSVLYRRSIHVELTRGRRSVWPRLDRCPADPHTGHEGCVSHRPKGVMTVVCWERKLLYYYWFDLHVVVKWCYCVVNQKCVACRY